MLQEGNKKKKTGKMLQEGNKMNTEFIEGITTFPQKKKTGKNNLPSVPPWNSDAEEAAWARRNLPNLTTQGLKRFKNRLKEYAGSTEPHLGNMVMLRKIEMIEKEIKYRETRPKNKSMRLEKWDKSGINMAGTSMGSYDKPMMKGGYDKPMMKSGCQISKHMGVRGAAMMGKKSYK